MDSGGRPRYVLEQIAERYPVVMHGVSLSIGSTDPLNFDYLAQAQAPGRRRPARAGCPITCAGPAWPACNAHDLLPIPLNEETLRARRRARPHRAGLPRTAAGAGEPQHLRHASPTRR